MAAAWRCLWLLVAIVALLALSSLSVQAYDEEDEDGEDVFDFFGDDDVFARVEQQEIAKRGPCALDLPAQYVNDDYCDCQDGSDEPLTSACSHLLLETAPGGFNGVPVLFSCKSGGQVFPSVMVNDGICDCCDGSDEQTSARCPNACTQWHDSELQRLRKRLADVQAGRAIRETYISAAAPKMDAINRDFQQMLSLARTLEASFESMEQQLTSRETEPSEAEITQIQSLYYALRHWQFQAYVHEKLVDKATFSDQEQMQKRAFAVLVGSCFLYTVNEKELKGGSANVIPREYDMIFCPFQNVTQSEPRYHEWTKAERRAKVSVPLDDHDESKQRETQDPIQLGIWDQWVSRDCEATSALATAESCSYSQHFNHGQKCATSEDRQVHVEMICGLENRVETMRESEMCVYSLTFATPAACDDGQEALVQHAIDRVLQQQQVMRGSYNVHEEL